MYNKYILIKINKLLFLLLNFLKDQKKLKYPNKTKNPKNKIKPKTLFPPLL